VKKILRASRTAKKTNEWILNNTGIRKELLNHCQSKKASILWSHHEDTRKLPEKEIMQGTMPSVCRRGRPHTAWMDNIKTWTGLTMEESIGMAEDRDKLRKYVHSVAIPQIEIEDS